MAELLKGAPKRTVPLAPAAPDAGASVPLGDTPQAEPLPSLDPPVETPLPEPEAAAPVDQGALSPELNRAISAFGGSDAFIDDQGFLNATIRPRRAPPPEQPEANLDSAFGTWEANKGYSTQMFQDALREQPESEFNRIEEVEDLDSGMLKRYGVFGDGVEKAILLDETAPEVNDTRTPLDKRIDTAVRGLGIGIARAALETAQMVATVTTAGPALGKRQGRLPEIDSVLKRLDAVMKASAGGDDIADTAGFVTSITAQVLAPLAVLTKTFKAAGASSLLADSLAEGLTGFAAMNPDEETLGALIPENSVGALGVLRSVLSIEPGDPELLKRLKQAGAALAALGAGTALIRYLPRAVVKARRAIAANPELAAAATVAGGALVAGATESEGAVSPLEPDAPEQRQDDEDLQQVAGIVGSLVVKTAKVLQKSASVQKLQKAIPVERRIAGGFDPIRDAGKVRTTREGGAYLEKNLKAPGGGARFTQIDIDRMWDESVAEAGEAGGEFVAKMLSAGKTFAPKEFKFWDDALRLPDRARYWYEISAEGFKERLSDLTPEALARFIDFVSATSPQAKPLDNLRRGLGAFAQGERGAPIDTSLVSPGSIRSLVQGSENAGLKTNSFAGTMKFHLGLDDTPPLSTNDRQVASSFGLTGEDIANQDAAYEILSRFYIKMRDAQNIGLPDAAEPFETWQVQALGWVQERTEKGNASMDDYLQALDVVVADLKAGGIDIPEGRLTKEVLTDPRIDTILSGTLQRFRDSRKATIESITPNMKTGRDAAELLEIAQRVGDTKAVAAHEALVKESLRSLITRFEKKPAVVDSILSAVTGRKVTTTRMVVGRGTFEGTVSSNIRVPLPVGLTKAQREGFLALLGRALRQKSMAASSFQMVEEGAPVAEDAVRTFTVFVPSTSGEVTEELIKRFEAALPEGHSLSVSDLPNGSVMEVNPRFDADGPVGPSADEIMKAVTDLQLDGASVSAADFISDFVESGVYGRKASALRKAVLNGEASKIKDLFGGDRASAIRALEGAEDGLRGATDGRRRRVEQARRRVEQRLDSLSEAVNPAREINDTLLRGQADWIKEVEPRLREAEALQTDIGPGASLTQPGALDDALDEEDAALSSVVQGFQEFDVAGGLDSLIVRLIQGKARRAIAKVKKGTKEQFLKGLSQDEIEVNRLNEFFDGKTGSVTQEEVQQHIDEFGGLDEVSLGGPEDSFDVYDTEAGVTIDVFDNEFDAYDAADRLNAEGSSDIYSVFSSETRANSDGPTKFDQWVLPGGTDYKETLIVMPPSLDEADRARAIVQLSNRQDGNRALFETALEAGDDAEVERLTAVGARLAKERTDVEALPVRESYDGGHFDDDNVLLHLRSNTRVTRNIGENPLTGESRTAFFLDELQSDWHQAGRTKGYQGAPLDTSKWRVERRSNDLSTRDVVLDERGEVVMSHPAEQAGVPEVSHEALIRAAEGVKMSKRVPSAPFKGTKWVALGLKRAIAEAAEGDFDSVAWTTGAQQTERYANALRNRVDTIEWTKTPEGVQLRGLKNVETSLARVEINELARLRARRADPGVMMPRFELLRLERMEFAAVVPTEVVNTRVAETELSDALGKVMADKIRDNPEQTGVISGDALTIDKTGMAEFYDRIMVSIANKIGKKYGAKVSAARVGAQQGVSGTDVLIAEGVVTESERARIWERLSSTQRQKRINEFREARDTVHELKLTPALIEAVQGGALTLAAVAGASAAFPDDATAAGPDIMYDAPFTVQTATQSPLPDQAETQTAALAAPGAPDGGVPEGEQQAQGGALLRRGLKALRASRRAGDLPVPKALPLITRRRSEIVAAGDDDITALSSRTDASKAERIAFAESTGNVSDLVGVDFNFDNFRTTDDINSVINEMSGLYAGAVNAETRGVISLQATKKMADALDMIPAVFQRKVGDLWNAEQMTAARGLMLQSAERLESLAGKARGADASDLDVLAFRRQMALHAAIQMRVKGAQTEIARALSSFRIPLGADGKASVDAVDALLQQFGGRSNSKELAEAYLRLDDPAKRNKLAFAGWGSTAKNIWMTVWINGLLSSPMTQVRNLVGNAVFQAWSIPETFIAGGVGAARRAFLPNANPDRVFIMEGVAQMYGMVTSIGTALRAAGKTLVTGVPEDALSKMEAMRPRAISGDTFNQTGWVGKAIDVIGAGVELPGRFLMAGDDLFKGTARGGANAQLAYRQAQQALEQGASRSDAVDLMVQQIRNPDPEMIETIDEAARYYTFTNKLDDFGRVLQKAQQFAAVRIIFPFLRTPANILKTFLARTPAAFLVKSARQDFLSGGARRDMAIARVGLGSAAMTYGVNLAMEGDITGRGPEDLSQRRALEATGWQKYSFFIKNDDDGESRILPTTIDLLKTLGIPVSKVDEGVYISYAGIEPIGLMLATSADTFDAMKWNMDADNPVDLASAAVMSVYDNLKSRSFMEGVQKFSEAANQGGGFLDNYIRGLARGGAILPKPFSSLIGRIGNKVDPVARDSRADPNVPLGYKMFQLVLRSYISNVPILQSSLPPLRNIWGDKITRGSGKWYEMANPFYISVAKYSPVERELIRLDTPITLPQRRIGGVPLSPEQYSDYIRLIGQDVPSGATSNLKNALASFIVNPKSSYNDDSATNDLERIMEVKRVYREYVQNAQMKLRVLYPDLNADLRLKEQLREMGVREKQPSRFLPQRGEAR